MNVQIGVNVFPLEFYDHIENVAYQTEEIDGRVHGDSLADSSVQDSRRSKIKYLNDPSIKQTLFHWVCEQNAIHYGFDIYSSCILQYTEYDASYKGHYDWHTDDPIYDPNNDTRSLRKLSITMPLSHSYEYEGGNLEIQDMNLPLEETRTKGNVILFPSFAAHRVTPVTKGRRKSLVAWFPGPNWR